MGLENISVETEVCKWSLFTVIVHKYYVCNESFPNSLLFSKFLKQCLPALSLCLDFKGTPCNWHSLTSDK